MKKHLYRVLFTLLSAFLMLQPAFSCADSISSTLLNRRQDARKKAQELREKNVTQYRLLQKKRNQSVSKLSQNDSISCCNCIVISAADFGPDLDETFVISTPGKYCLGEDVAFAPADEFTPAINILSNDVILDLCGHTLSQANSTANGYGVQIGQGYFFNDLNDIFQNITIKNGTIREFSAIGIFCYNGSFAEPFFDPTPFKDLHFTDLNILECGPVATTESMDFASGINLDSNAQIPSFIVRPSDPVAYSEVIIEDCHINRCVGHGAISVFTFEDLIVKGTQANDLVTFLDQTAFGCFAYGLTGRNLQMSDCQGNGTQDLDPTFFFGQVGGAGITASLNVFVKDCQFNDAFGLADVTVASQFEMIENGIFENCQFNNNRGGELALTVNGAHMSESGGPGENANTNGLRFINCQFNGSSIAEKTTDNEDSAAEIAGFAAITMSNLILENCQACNMMTTNLQCPAYGFKIGTNPRFDVLPGGPSRNVTLSNCVASDISGGTDSVGIWTFVRNRKFQGVQFTQVNIVIENCIAERISSLASKSDNTVAGIAEGLSAFVRTRTAPTAIPTQFDRMINLQVRGCRVSDVRSNVGGKVAPLSAGIVVASVLNPVISDNSVSDCDRGILFSGTNDIIPNGFQVAATLADALANPPVFIPIGAPSVVSQVQTFTDLTQKNKVDVLVPDQVNTQHSFILLKTPNLTKLNWQSGDVLLYDNKGGTNITGLVSGQKYFAIVYRPGFTENGLVQNNNVSNCSISGYQDDRRPTSSAWINNIALLNGTKPSHRANFAIKWPNKEPQVDEGTLGRYPKHPNKNFNLSLIKDEKKKTDCKHKRSHASHK